MNNGRVLNVQKSFLSAEVHLLKCEFAHYNWFLIHNMSSDKTQHRTMTQFSFYMAWGYFPDGLPKRFLLYMLDVRKFTSNGLFNEATS